MPTESLSGRPQQTCEYGKDTVGLFNPDQLKINARLIPHKQASMGIPSFSRHITTGNRASSLSVERLQPFDRHRHVATHGHKGPQRILTLLMGMKGSHDGKKLAPGI